MRLRLTLRDCMGRPIGSMETPTEHYIAPGYKVQVVANLYHLLPKVDYEANGHTVVAEVEILDQRETGDCNCDNQG